MFLILCFFGIVVFMLLLGFIGEIIGSFFNSSSKNDEEIEIFEEFGTQNVIDQLK